MIHLKHEPPEPQAYCDLRKVAGMSTKSLAAARKGLPNALFTVALYSEQQLIGLGRVIAYRSHSTCFFLTLTYSVISNYFLFHYSLSSFLLGLYIKSSVI